MMDLNGAESVLGVKIKSEPGDSIDYSGMVPVSSPLDGSITGVRTAVSTPNSHMNEDDGLVGAEMHQIAVTRTQSSTPDDQMDVEQLPHHHQQLVLQTTNVNGGTTTTILATCQVCTCLSTGGMTALEENQALQLRLFLEDEYPFATNPVTVCATCFSLLSDLRYLENTFVSKKSELQTRRQRALRREINGDPLSLSVTGGNGGSQLVQGIIDLNQLVEHVGIVPTAAVTVTNATTGAIVATTEGAKAILAAKQHHQQQVQIQRHSVVNSQMIQQTQKQTTSFTVQQPQSHMVNGNQPTPNTAGLAGAALKQVLNKDGQLAPYICTFEGCGRRYVLKRSLKEHERGHLEGKCHKCQFCGKGFRRHKDLRVHELLHSYRSRFPCPFCPKGFVIRSRLTRHMKIHASSAQFGCRLAGCNVKFTSKDEAMEHAREHGDIVGSDSAVTMMMDSTSSDPHGEDDSDEGELDEEDEAMMNEREEGGTGLVHHLSMNSTGSSPVTVNGGMKQQHNTLVTHFQVHHTPSASEDDGSDLTSAGYHHQQTTHSVSSIPHVNPALLPSTMMTPPVTSSSSSPSLVTVSLDEALRETDDTSIHTPPHNSHSQHHVKVEVLEEGDPNTMSSNSSDNNHQQQHHHISSSPVMDEQELSHHHSYNSNQSDDMCIKNEVLHHLQHSGGVPG